MGSHLVRNEGGALLVVPLPLPIDYVAAAPDAELFRAQARGELPPPPLPPLRGGALRAFKIDCAQGDEWLQDLGSELLFIVSGELRLSVAGKPILVARAGDIIRIASSARGNGAAGWKGAATAIALVIPGLSDDGVPAPSGIAGEQGLLARMYAHPDGESRFRDFPELFDFSGSAGEARAIEGIRILRVFEGMDFDWHPEVVNNLVLVLSGALELEVGGGSDRVRRFGPGSVCLAEDRTGKGHIDRTYGDCCIIVARMANDEIWLDRID